MVAVQYEKIKTLLHHPALEPFKDVRALGFVVFGIMVLLVSYSGVNVIQTNYVLQKQAAELRQKNTIAELENSTIRLQNQYYSSDAYLELAARQQFGKGQPGETLLLVPKGVALLHTVEPPIKATDDKKTSQKPRYQRNFEAWRRFLFHQYE